MSGLRIVFAGDRDIAVWVLRFILDQDVSPLALLISDQAKASHAEELMALCPFLEPGRMLEGDAFRERRGLGLLTELELDYIICIHFPYVIPKSVLSTPRLGVVNLHPAYLPYNRGWHTPSWAIIEETPIGATLHLMDGGIDTGDIIHQKPVQISPGDTADTLYQRVKRVELEVFREAWPQLVSRSFVHRPQNPSEATDHRSRDLLTDHIQRIDLEARVKAGDLIRRLRALTTNRVDEAAYYEVSGRRYRIQVSIHEESKSN